MIAGIDEAGRGPVIGPMVMAIVAINKCDEKFLKEIGVKDSKLLSPNKREELYKIIKSKFENKIIIVKPVEIDKNVLDEESSLNVLEAKTTAKLINSLIFDFEKVYVDLPSKNKNQYVYEIEKRLKSKVDIIAEFKADVNYLCVSAASILAKVTRDREIEKIKQKLNIDIGSGYPSDPQTIDCLDKNFDFLKENKVLRLSWKTITDLEEKKVQTTLSSFS
jgi:ribonuclease HII